MPILKLFDKKKKLGETMMVKGKKYVVVKALEPVKSIRPDSKEELRKQARKLGIQLTEKRVSAGGRPYYGQKSKKKLMKEIAGCSSCKPKQGKRATTVFKPKNQKKGIPGNKYPRDVIIHEKMAHNIAEMGLDRIPHAVPGVNPNSGRAPAPVAPISHLQAMQMGLDQAPSVSGRGRGRGKRRGRPRRAPRKRPVRTKRPQQIHVNHPSMAWNEDLHPAIEYGSGSYAGYTAPPYYGSHRVF